jgi:hypothetical protein
MNKARECGEIVAFASLARDNRGHYPATPCSESPMDPESIHHAKTSKRPLYIPLCAEDDYAELRRVCKDGGEMSPAYSEFFKSVEKVIKLREAEGLPFVKVYIKPGDLVAWCAARGKQVDAAARREYALSIIVDERKGDSGS